MNSDFRHRRSKEDATKQASTLRTTPAVALGIADHVWSIGELIDAALAMGDWRSCEETGRWGGITGSGSIINEIKEAPADTMRYNIGRGLLLNATHGTSDHPDYVMTRLTLSSVFLRWNCSILLTFTNEWAPSQDF